jgi:hypothetical protein
MLAYNLIGNNQVADRGRGKRSDSIGPVNDDGYARASD